MLGLTGEAIRGWELVSSPTEPTTGSCLACIAFCGLLLPKGKQGSGEERTSQLQGTIDDHMFSILHQPISQRVWSYLKLEGLPEQLWATHELCKYFLHRRVVSPFSIRRVGIIDWWYICFGSNNSFLLDHLLKDYFFSFLFLLTLFPHTSF